MKVNIHNQRSDFVLMSGGYFINNARWIEYPDKEVYAADMMSADLLPLLSTFECGLTYVLQRNDVKPGEQLKETRIRLFVAWKSEGYKKFCVFVQLIECNKQSCWDILKIEECYQRYASQLSTYTDLIRDTWLIHDGTVLMTELDLDFTQRDDVLNITLSEGIKDECTKKPEWINLEK
jgi:hypothetical protein